MKGNWINSDIPNLAPNSLYLPLFYTFDLDGKSYVTLYLSGLNFRLVFKSIYIFFICMLLVSGSFAQGLPGSGGSSDLGDKNFDFIPLPYINYSRSLGFTAGAIPMAMYRINPSDTVSPASISGLMGMYTTNDTWFAMFFSQLYLNQDFWRITTAGGLGSINFQFYLDAPVSGVINYNTQADFFFIEAQRKVKGHLYMGLNYLFMQYNTTFGR